MSKIARINLILGVWLGLFIAGAAFGQSGTVGEIAGYTSTNFTYESPDTGYDVTTNGGLVYVSATFVKPPGMELLGLLADPTLPAGWTVDIYPGQSFGLYDSSLPSKADSVPALWVSAYPAWVPVSGKFLYEGSGFGKTATEATIKLNFAMYVPPGDTGDKELSIVWEYTPASTGIETDLPCSDNPVTIQDLNPPPPNAGKSGTLMFGR